MSTEVNSSRKQSISSITTTNTTRTASSRSSKTSKSSSTKKIPSYPIPKYDHVKSKIASSKSQHIEDKGTSSSSSTSTRPNKVSYASKRASMVSSPSNPTDYSMDIKSHVKSKVGSLDNINHKPGGGDRKVFDEKVHVLKEKIVSKAKPKIGSLDNIKHQPGGGDKKIFDEKVHVLKERIVSKAKPKVGSLDNINHKPGGGDRKVFDEKVHVLKEKIVSKAKPKVRSLDNVKHKPGGDNVTIFDDKNAKPKAVASKIENSIKEKTKHTTMAFGMSKRLNGVIRSDSYTINTAESKEMPIHMPIQNLAETKTMLETCVDA